MKTRAFLLLMSLTSCVSIQSNVKSGAVPTFSRVLVVTKLRQPPAGYSQTFLKAFPVGYQVCAVDLSPLSFDNPDEIVRRQVESCQSEVILTLEMTQAGRAGDSGLPAQYNAEMRSVATNQLFWKALISSDIGEVTPRSVLKRLRDDQIIEGKLPPSATQSVSY